ncbi:unnamed protein product [Coffea canephora]|uniref:RanBD1 domain-containing protein n=1 Tax=Coffea canephora TaxID=49390 RepID=A0A068TPX0_COFCA|nr:unnamed protein product [Coffea canephora]
MGDAESNVQPSKKRAAGRELSRDNPGLDDDEEGSSEQEMGTFKRASEEVLAGRRIVKVRRNQSSTTPSAPSSNPFAGIRLVPPNSGATTAHFAAEADSGKSVADNEVKTVGSEEIDNKSDENENELESRVNEPDTGTIGEKENNYNEEGPNKLEVADDKAEKVTCSENNIEKDDKENAEVKECENEDRKDDDNASVDKSGEAASFSSFQQLSSSRNAFTGLSGTGFSSSTFSFGSLGSGSGSGSLFGSKVDSPSFGFGLSNNGSSSLFGSSGASTITKSEGSGFSSMQEVPVETGEENEKPVFVADSVLFEYHGGSWKERGKGELKVNVPTSGTAKARLVMRTRGNYRLILNASLYPDMKLTDMEKKGVTFACVNSIGDGKDGLSTFALRFKDASIVDEFRACVIEHKAKNPVTLKTPENSPKASDG